MKKHNARCTRRRAEPGVSARGASSRGGCEASGTLEVSPPPPRHSAPPRCRLRITLAFSSFACLRPTKDSWRGRALANRRSFNWKALPQWVYSLLSVDKVHSFTCFVICLSHLFRNFESQTEAAKCHEAGVWPFRAFSVSVCLIPRSSFESSHKSQRPNANFKRFSKKNVSRQPTRRRAHAQDCAL